MSFAGSIPFATSQAPDAPTRHLPSRRRRLKWLLEIHAGPKRLLQACLFAPANDQDTPPRSKSTSPCQIHLQQPIVAEVDHDQELPKLPKGYLRDSARQGELCPP